MLPGPRKAGMLVKGGEGFRRRWDIRGIQLDDPAEETGSDHISWTGSHQLSSCPECRAVFGAVCSPQLIPGGCLSAKWKSAETEIDSGQKLKFRTLKESLTFGRKILHLELSGP